MKLQYSVALDVLIKKECTGANYFPINETCTLLHVEDELDDWENTGDDVTYMCVDCDPQGEWNFNMVHLISPLNTMGLRGHLPTTS